jgi:hypothetical protein
VEPGQLRDVVANYLREKPQRRNAEADRLIYLAIRDAWPCP